MLRQMCSQRACAAPGFSGLGPLGPHAAGAIESGIDIANFEDTVVFGHDQTWWAFRDLNPEPTVYETAALTN